MRSRHRRDPNGRLRRALPRIAARWKDRHGPSIRGKGIGNGAGPTEAANREKADALRHPAPSTICCGPTTFTSGTFFLFNTAVPEKPARQSQYGGTTTNACRAASMAARRSTDLFGGSTGVLICIPQHGTWPGETQRAKVQVPRFVRKTTPAVALTSRTPDCQSRPPAFQAGGEPAGRSQVPRARIRAPIPYYLREVPYARRSNRPMINSSQCEASCVPISGTQKCLTKLA